MYGTEQSASVEPSGSRRLIDAVTKIDNASGSGVTRIIKEEKTIAGKLRTNLVYM